MSLTSSLFAGVSGLTSQGNVMGIIGDNIANISTTGFKSGQTTFSSLVTGDGGGGNAAGSGVISRARLNIDQQGLIQSTGIATDIAVSGKGFFVVKDNPNAGAGNFLYTRAGSFRQDEKGNFVNAANFVLLGWPLDSEGRLPGAIGNLDTTSSQLLESLDPINTRSISGLAFATTSIKLGLNLNAGETILTGAGDTAKPVSTLNDGTGADDILAVTTGEIETGDTLRITTGDGSTFDYIYGGFHRSYDITDSNMFGAATSTQRFTPSTTAGADYLQESDQFTITTVSAGTVTFTYKQFSPNADLGTFNSLETLAQAIDAIPALNARVAGNRLYVSADDAREAISFADVGTATIISEGSIFATGNFQQSETISASNNIWGATTTTGTFTSLSNGNTFTIDTASISTATFTFQSSSPTASSGQFNSLQTLADAINAVTYTGGGSLNARIVDDTLLVFSDDPTETVTIADGSGTPLGLSNGPGFSAGDNTISVTSTNRFNTLQGLTDLVNEEDLISASMESAASDSSVTITVNDPLETITFSDGSGSVGSLTTEFGLSTTTFNPVYDASGVSGKNMASGDIAPAFSRNIRIFDSLGTGHDMRISFVKADNNKWLVEVFMADEGDIVTTSPNGQVATGEILFNGDGSLRNVSTALSTDIQVVWANGAVASTINIDWGTAGSPAGTVGATVIGKTDGLSQFNGPYNVQFADQNGASSGLLSSIEIDEQGFIIANFSNGQSRQVFKLPLATFPNPNGLSPKAGNVYSSSDASGEFSLNEPGSASAGTISVAALESANVELADELTKMIIAQRAFQANTKIITTADQLLEDLNRIG